MTEPKIKDDMEVSTVRVQETSSSGVASIKSEYIVPSGEKAAVFVPDVNKNSTTEDDSNVEPPQKRSRKNRRGQNKARPLPFKEDREGRLCPSLVDVGQDQPWPQCANSKCACQHDVAAFLRAKPRDIAPTCYLYSVRGSCPRGLTCRFGSQHLTEDGKNIKKIVEGMDVSSGVVNSLTKELQLKLRKRLYDFSRTEEVISDLEKHRSKQRELKIAANNELRSAKNGAVSARDAEMMDVGEGCDAGEHKPLGPVSDEDIIPVRKEERKKLDWSNKLYLSPLTTVGNLPFRRICRQFGADITCGEMALASSLLQGAPQEWALVKRHHSEEIFGVQLCGSNPNVMTRCAQLLEDQLSLDFVDVNLGCPIELIYQNGAGSGLLRRERMLEAVLRSMNNVLGLPLTVKTRTGVGKNIAHTLAPRFASWGVSLITIHGRSREQRYTRTADWDYIERCAALAGPTPVFGNGDILSHEDHQRVLARCPSVQGVMVGRGALIKPWIFTEIKERRHYDISSSERLDMLRQYANYGLEHWGSDTKGVENTRRFLLEWLSFLYRYIPVGLLERPPQKMNERPPTYRGRDDLETLMASANCADWIKISEMLLGPVPDNYCFLPKHKANSWV
ncbi:tRNA-dihydrouridine(47) synthase [NAD(P)(+)]-like [Bacillus rossius redtenbacheri]|uniref:tRNA-dihydrouridine(47) synthase [NAD(P)(+)]-like n=1 Tax=Bacillus rossius redtenbacheri TaxID=93214 RepID=UPI002FDEEEC5